MVNPRVLAGLALGATLFALSVIELGAFTRLIDAGLGCPDWPLCYGHFMVPNQASAAGLSSQYPGSYLNFYKASAEMIHRYCAGILSLLIIGIIVLSFTKSLGKFSNKILSGALGLLIVYQILLGQWTVTLKLLPLVVTLHLIGGFSILSILWLLYLNNSRLVNVNPSLNGLSILTVGGLGILLIQIILGAWTSTNYASLSCTSFPFCGEGALFPMHFSDAFNLISPIGLNYEGGILPEGIRQTIQMTHRVGALVFTLYLLMLSFLAFPKFKNFLPGLRLIFLSWVLLMVQILLGISNIIFKLPLLTAIGHNFVAALLLLTMLSLIHCLLTMPPKVSPPC